MSALYKTILSLNGMDWAILGVLCLLLLLLFFRHSRPSIQKLTARDDVRGYGLIYADQKQGKKHEEDFGKLLYSAKYDLQGKPDYVFQSPVLKRIVPVELKSGDIDEEELPHHGDLLQLGAYFLILEDVYGQKPPFGRIVYRDYMFEIRNTAKIRNEVLDTMKEMREMLEYGVGKAKPSFATCRPCVCNGTVCEFSETERIKGEEEQDDSCGEE
ncbi:MAG: CRISPR-associated protein Cas4 [Bacillota bacterium]|nr:CRISPR-associated protein Cas4 [Bacillota bacterium]